MATPNQNTTPVINVALSGINAIDALIMGTRWDTTSLSYSFADKNSVWSTDPMTGYGAKTSYSEPWDVLYKGLNDTEKQAAQSALTAWSNIANISFNQVTESSSTVGEIRFAWSSAGGYDGGQAHVADFPSNDPIAGDIWLNDYQYVTWDGFDPGKYGYLALLHELGHALGLKHTFQATGSSSETLPADQDSYANSIMSYSASPNEPYSTVSYNPTTPMLDDIAAIQYLYGANTNYNAGDDTYVFKPYGDYFQTIWDGGGNDTIVWQGSDRDPVTIDLRAGHWSTLGNPLFFYKENGSVLTSSVNTVAIANNVTIENATGGKGNDTLIGNDANNVLTGGGGNDSVYGYAGDDTLVAGTDLSRDVLYGGEGNDVYILDVHSIFNNVVEFANQGFDEFQSYNSVSLSRFANIEEIVLLGSEALNASGNWQNNWIKGNAGDNTLAGLGGNDIFMFDPSSKNGLDTILDISAGDKIEILGAQLSGVVTLGDGQFLGNNEVQCQIQPGKYTVLYIGTDSIQGADIAIRLPYVFSVDNMQLTGSDFISFTGEQSNQSPIGSINVSPPFFRGSGYQFFEVTSQFYDPDGVGDFSYKWFADGVEIQGETSSLLGYSTSLIGKKITAQLSYVDGQGYSELLSSEGGAPVNGTLNIVKLGSKIEGVDNFNTVSFWAKVNPVNLDLAKSIVSSKDGHAILKGIQNVFATQVSDKVNGNSADNLIDGVGGKDTLSGGAGNDTIQGTGALSGGAGDDVLISRFGSIYNGLTKLSGNQGNDTLQGGNNNINILSGGSGNDDYYVDAYTSKLNLKPGFIHDSAKSQILENPNGGTDTVYSLIDFVLSDNVESLVLSNTIQENSGLDININGVGNGIANTIVGNWGNNILDGKLGKDTLTGGEGYDIFAFDTKLSKTNVDTVTDFFSPADIIALNTKVFSSLKTGFDFAKDFITSDHLADQDSSDHLIYDTSTGDLYYDADGSGKLAAIKFLTLLDAPTLEAGNFKIYSNDADLLNLTY